MTRIQLLEITSIKLITAPSTLEYFIVWYENIVVCSIYVVKCRGGCVGLNQKSGVACRGYIFSRHCPSCNTFFVYIILWPHDTLYVTYRCQMTKLRKLRTFGQMTFTKFYGKIWHHKAVCFIFWYIMPLLLRLVMQDLCCKIERSQHFGNNSSSAWSRCTVDWIVTSGNYAALLLGHTCRYGDGAVVFGIPLLRCWYWQVEVECVVLWDGDKYYGVLRHHLHLAIAIANAPSLTNFRFLTFILAHVRFIVFVHTVSVNIS